MCYNKYSEREVNRMFAVKWRYINEDLVQFSTMTSRQLWNFRLDPCVVVLDTVKM